MRSSDLDRNVWNFSLYDRAKQLRKAEREACLRRFAKLLEAPPSIIPEHKPNGLSVVQLNTSNRVMGGFSRDGARFITTPHAGDGSVTIHSWPDARIVDDLDAPSVFFSMTS